MAKETWLSLEPHDIYAIMVSCRHCGHQVQMRLKKVTVGEQDYQDIMPDACPVCDTSWKNPQEVSAATNLRRALYAFIRDKSPFGYTVRLTSLVEQAHKDDSAA